MVFIIVYYHLNPASARTHRALAGFRYQKKTVRLMGISKIFYLNFFVYLIFIQSANAFFTTSARSELSLASATVDYIYDYQKDQQLLIDANVKIILSDEMQRALHHEIDFFFITKVELEKKVNLMIFDSVFDFFKNQKYTHYKTKLSYSSYNKTYRLTNFRNQQTRQFKSLKDALYTLGAIHHFPVTELAKLHPGKTYQIKVKIELLPWRLPSPLIITALTQPEWQLESDWHKITIHAPKSWY